MSVGKRGIYVLPIALGVIALFRLYSALTTRAVELCGKSGSAGDRCRVLSASDNPGGFQGYLDFLWLMLATSVVIGAGIWFYQRRSRRD